MATGMEKTAAVHEPRQGGRVKIKVNLVDFHAHILPGIDDGAKDGNTALNMLSASKQDGVATIVATPHFYGEKRSVGEFLEERNASYERLMTAARENNADIPDIRLGAEVYLRPELSQDKELPRLCIEGTRYLLLEMPYSQWNRWMYDEIYQLEALYDIRIILAHLERFTASVREFEKYETLLSMNLVVQVNASSVLERPSKKIVKQLLKEDAVHLLGSDCHNMTTRPPGLSEACKKLEKIAGADLPVQLFHNANQILANEIIL